MQALTDVCSRWRMTSPRELACDQHMAHELSFVNKPLSLRIITAVYIRRLNSLTMGV
jgi:hypothetical protein